MASARAKWSRLVSEWKRSGLTAPAFAARRGIRAGTLVWWSWRLRKDGRGDAVEVDFVPVEVLAPAQDAYLWQLTSIEGHVLRVCGAMDVDTVREVLAVITTKRRPR